MKLLILLISIEFLLIVSGDTEVKHFYIENNRLKCALMDLRSDIDVIYSTKFGSNTTNLKMTAALEDQSGMCNNGTDATFNITINPKLDAFLNFDFKNSYQIVSLTSIQFGYKLTNNSYFPDSTQSGYFSKRLYTNVSLSKSTNFYQCRSKIKINLSENITVNIYFAKLKVFNVANSSFGDGMDECAEDFNLTTVSTSKTTFTTLTSETKTTEKTVTTSTYVTTKSSLSTSLTSKSHIPTSHTSTVPSTHASTTSNHSTETSSTKFSTHLSSMSSTISSTTMPTTVKPDQVFLYAVKDKTVVFLLIESVIDATINYNKKSKILTFSNSSFTGNCSANSDTITITSVPDASLTLIFSKKDDYSVLTEIRLTYVDQNVHINEIKTINDCKVSWSKGYYCKDLTYQLINSTIHLQKFHYEAFRNSSNSEFQAEPTNCEIAHPNQIVAIVVGIVLAGFLVIIVVVFLILRYRANKRRNYEEI